MHNEGMNRQQVRNAALYAEIDGEIDARLVRALETRPEMSIPADFAARITRQLPERPPVLLTPRYYGRNAMVICMVILVAALLALALHSGSNSPLWVALEWIVCAQIVSLAVWLGKWQRELR
jgi:hypothetical protein